MITVTLKVDREAWELHEKQVAIRVLNTTRHYHKMLTDIMTGIADTWTPENRPVWETPPVHYAQGDIYFHITTDSKIFGWLDEGTSVRWALMSFPYGRRTAYRTFEPQVGEGHAVIRGKKAMQKKFGPDFEGMPGIEGREWTLEIEELYEEEFYDAIENAITEGLAAAGL